ncbi:MAG TPA: DUF4383 domain-containing protein [Candidatus Limnocylindrales bacterium]|nr:DUF4383 domain-containing protein [Candidatus Limnocylindrales bacterium]
MNVRSTALWVGVVILVVGLVGFVPPLVPDGKVLGIFLVDPFHNIVHILTGALAIFASKSSESAARTYFKVFGVVYALVTVLGFTTGNGLLGLIPVNGADNFLHLAIAAAYLYFGFGTKAGTAKA